MKQRRRPIYYDTETTGIRTDRDRIIEIAAYDPERDLTFERFVNPGCPIPPDATAIHKITNEMVAEAPPFSDVAFEFVKFCEGDVILIAHNNDAFDREMLRHEFKRHAVEMPQWTFLDSLKWARRYRSDLPRHTLQFLRETFGIPANNAHRALDDVKILHQIFSLMLDDLTIDQAFELLNLPRALHHMPFGKHQGTPLNKIPATYVSWLASQGVFDKPDNKELKEAFQRLNLLSV